MDGATLQKKIWRGYAKAADKIGASYTFYRPSAGTTPTAWTDNSGNLNNPIYSRNVSLNAEDMKYGKPNKYGKGTWYALVDGTDLQPGDYFKGQQGTLFLAAMQLLLPILAVECNRTVSISRVPSPSGFGASGYSSMIDRAPYITGVPCSILQGTKGEKNDVNLPGDTRTPWWTVLMPAAVGSVSYSDTITDDLGNRYIVSSAELTELGYRLTAMLAIP